MTDAQLDRWVARLVRRVERDVRNAADTRPQEAKDYTADMAYLHREREVWSDE